MKEEAGKQGSREAGKQVCINEEERPKQGAYRRNMCDSDAVVEHVERGHEGRYQ